jgi:hypothetical protein
MLSRIVTHIVSYESSTRSVACIRIGLVCLLWSRFSVYLLPYKNLPTEQIAIGMLFFVASIFVFIGYYTRFWLFVLALVMILVYHYVGFVLDVEPITHHHTYLLCMTTVLLSLTPCGRSFSVDRLLLVRKSLRNNLPVPPESGALWATYLIGLQISSIYFWSTYSKLVPGFMSGERMEQIFKYYYCSFDFIDSSLFAPAMFLLAVATIILELFLALGLWFARIHVLVLPAGIIFHLILFYTLPVSTFSFTMILLYLVFIPPEKVHRVIDEVTGGYCGKKL